MKQGAKLQRQQQKARTVHEAVRIAAWDLAASAWEEIDDDTTVNIQGPEDYEIERSPEYDASSHFCFALAFLAGEPDKVIDYSGDKVDGEWPKKTEPIGSYVNRLMITAHNATVLTWGRNYDADHSARKYIRGYLMGVAAGWETAQRAGASGMDVTLPPRGTVLHNGQPVDPKENVQYNPEDIEMTVDGKPVKPAPLPTTLRSKGPVTIGNGKVSLNLTRLRKALVCSQKYIVLKEYENGTRKIVEECIEELDASFPMLKEDLE